MVDYPAISRITDPANVRAMLLQGKQPVSAPLTGLGLQPLAAGLTDIAALTPADRNFIVGNGTHWVAKNGQLPFPATPNPSADANTLDDYKETATFTPGMTSGTGTITTLGTATGWATKVGNLVTGGIDITITTNGTGATNLSVTGLPYTTGAASTAVGQEVAGTGKAITGYIPSGGTAINQITFYDATYPGANGRRLVMSFAYRAT